ncbi:MAG: crotonase/enoyl-CoA hydratase family protein [Polyangiaceae bacterium]|nr:crotonase/enoyl-CoA hydratase family protein [Myxococcales bacterium]MCB9587515.1 crotonase/enoyl-CoA hydratase family protein [Polyangiaceae bacterium]MCB9605688.1 crotonase/enoyl-CoA hydratase family protein [Polyangiaceae bacterium]
MADSIQYELNDGVAILTLDDGKANALGHDVVMSLGQHLDKAEQEASAVLIVGREGKFSAGYNLKEMMAGPDSARKLVKAGGELMMRIFTFPRPVVAACTGHALAAGGILLLACDLRIGADGPFKIGLNEVPLGMTPPMYLVELARHRLSKRWYTRAVTQGQIFSPSEAADVGYLDACVGGEELLSLAKAEAKRLGALPHGAFAEAKRREREALATAVLQGIDADMNSFKLDG